MRDSGAGFRTNQLGLDVERQHENIVQGRAQLAGQQRGQMQQFDQSAQEQPLHMEALSLQNEQAKVAIANDQLRRQKAAQDLGFTQAIMGVDMQALAREEAKLRVEALRYEVEQKVQRNQFDRFDLETQAGIALYESEFGETPEFSGGQTTFRKLTPGQRESAKGRAERIRDLMQRRSGGPTSEDRHFDDLLQLARLEYREGDPAKGDEIMEQLRQAAGSRSAPRNEGAAEPEDAEAIARTVDDMKRGTSGLSIYSDADLTKLSRYLHGIAAENVAKINAIMDARGSKNARMTVEEWVAEQVRQLSAQTSPEEPEHLREIRRAKLEAAGIRTMGMSSGTREILNGTQR